MNYVEAYHQKLAAAADAAVPTAAALGRLSQVSDHMAAQITADVALLAETDGRQMPNLNFIGRRAVDLRNTIRDLQAALLDLDARAAELIDFAEAYLRVAGSSSVN